MKGQQMKSRMDEPMKSKICVLYPAGGNSPDRKREWMALCMILLVGAALLFSTGVASSQEGKQVVKVYGTLTSIEDDGTVVIDGKGYDVSPEVRVINKNKKRVLLQDLNVPTAVYIEFIYVPGKGPEIMLLKETPQ